MVWLQIALITVTAVYTVGTFLLWSLTKKSIRISIGQQKILQAQQELQIKEMKSYLERDTIERHRNLFSSIISAPQLLRVFAEETGYREEVVLRQFLATLLINHARVMYLDYSINVGPEESFEGFTLDFKEILQFKFMKNRWQEVRMFHPKKFRDFTDKLIADGSK